MNFSCYQKGIAFCDKNLSGSWWPKIENVLKGQINIADIHYLEPTEETKSVENYGRLVDHLGSLKCSRDDLIIAVGGGTILDTVSYLASTYMRGITLFMIPTTLVGQADASTAGKTCINTRYAKNVLGTLYLPTFVYNNVSILKTNSEYDYRQGFSEVFKYGLLGSQVLLDLMVDYKQCPTDVLMMNILRETIRVRIDIRKKDPLASNLGHTFGHALEKITKYAVNHGDAISAGIVMALEFSVSEGLVEPNFKNKIVNLMRILGLNTKVSTGINPELLTNTMLTDKKSSNTLIRLVLIKEIARPFEHDGNYFYGVNPEKVLNFLKSFLTDENYVNEYHWEALKGK
jgi:3-dehydroquinate synthetase